MKKKKLVIGSYLLPVLSIERFKSYSAGHDRQTDALTLWQWSLNCRPLWLPDHIPSVLPPLPPPHT